MPEVVSWVASESLKTSSVQLRDRIFSLTAEGTRAADDRGFASDIRRSSRSAPANLAEGFGAFYPKESARFYRIARRSMIETRNHLHEGRTLGYLSDTEAGDLMHLAFRAQKATTRLIKYLESCD